MLFGFLLDHIPDRIYFKDTASRFVRVSRAKAQRHGVSDPARLIGKTDCDLFTAEHAREALADEQQILRTGEAIVGKVEKETLPDGTVQWALTTKMPLRNSRGEIIGTCGISKDITAMKEMEDALAQANADLAHTLAELKRAQGQLVEAEKAQTAARLAAGVAHEVRNPLNILNTGVEFFCSSPAVAEDATMGLVAGEMREAIQRAEAVICALIESSKDFALAVERSDLNAVVSAAIASMQRELTTRQIDVHLELAGDLPQMMLDAKRIKTVLDCVLRNALDAMSPGGGELTVRTRQEPLAESEFDPGARSGRQHHVGDTAVVLEVDDTGCGIPPESLAAVFDPFFTTKATGSGTGLGLTVARKILELHGASIAVSNRPAGGVRVRMRFSP